MLSLWNEYRDWLLRCVGYRHLVSGKGSVLPANSRYSKLLNALNNFTFKVIVDRDVNRVKDGLSLRDDFLYDIGIASGELKEPCSVLEVLVALAIRVNDEYIGDPYDPHPEFIFWEFIVNLGLDKYDDAHFSSEKVDKILDTFVDRTYNYDGNGGILPIKSPLNDQRDTEIWVQMMAYLSEKY